MRGHDRDLSGGARRGRGRRDPAGATPAEREEGIAFWVETAGGDRVGYGPLVSYAPGVGEGAPVTAGQPLGIDSGLLRLAWTRDGRRIDPFPLLEATRPPAPAP